MLDTHDIMLAKTDPPMKRNHNRPLTRRDQLIQRLADLRTAQRKVDRLAYEVGGSYSAELDEAETSLRAMQERWWLGCEAFTMTTLCIL